MCKARFLTVFLTVFNSINDFMNFYENIESERDRIQTCISKYGHTSDHNLDWWACSIITPDGKPVFVEFLDGSGLLAHKYPDKWRIWSDPLCEEKDMANKMGELAVEIFKDNKIKELWCDDVSDTIYPELKNGDKFKTSDIFYSLYWPVLDMEKYDHSLPGGHFKEMRNARSKFYREHKIEVIKADMIDKKELIRIVDDWKKLCRDSKSDPEYIYDLRYRLIIDKSFHGFNSARVIVADGRPVGFNAGYEVPNHSGRFAGVIGIHDYSIKDLGTILWLEDLDWVKNAGYKEMDLQGDEEHGGLKLKLGFGGKIERKTDTFFIKL